MKLTQEQRRELELLIQYPKNGSSDQVRDRARAKLKALGMIRFNRKAWAWKVLLACCAGLKAAMEARR